MNCRYTITVNKAHPPINQLTWKGYYEVLEEIKNLKSLQRKYGISNITDSLNSLNIFLQHVRTQIRQSSQQVYLLSRLDKKLSIKSGIQRITYKQAKIDAGFIYDPDLNSSIFKQKSYRHGQPVSVSFSKSLIAAKKHIKDQLKEKRRIARVLNRTQRQYQDGRRNGQRYPFYMIGLLTNGLTGKGTGFVHEQSNSILNIKLTKQATDIYEYKGPKTKSNHVGVEIEFFCKWDKTELAANLVKNNMAGYCTIKQDGSIRPEAGMIGHELCVLATEDSIQNVIKIICNILTQAEAKVNKSCGLHIHLDMRNRDKEMTFNNLVSSQPVLYGMNPLSRRDSTYCKLTTTKDFTQAGNDRYRGINPSAYGKHKTLEVRIHAGTISENKINKWIELLLAIVNVKEVQRTTLKLRTFIKQYKISSDLASYMAERLQKFKNETTPIEEAA